MVSFSTKQENIETFYIIYVNYLYIMHIIRSESRVDLDLEETPSAQKADWQRTVHTLFCPSINAPRGVQKLYTPRTNVGNKS